MQRLAAAEFCITGSTIPVHLCHTNWRAGVGSQVSPLSALLCNAWGTCGPGATCMVAGSGLAARPFLQLSARQVPWNL